MKQHFHSLLTLILIVAAALPLGATVRTVNNSTNLPVNPGQYTDIQSAISASSPGDTLMVAGTLNNYSSNISLNKRLAIIGAGYNPDKSNPLSTKITGNLTVTDSAASGSYLAGFDFNSTITMGQGNALTLYINNITFTRCLMRSSFYINDSTVNLTLSNCLFKNAAIFIQASKSHINMQFLNNIFYQPYYSYYISAPSFAPTNYLPIKIDHNLFLAGSYSTPLLSSNFSYIASTLRNAVISNNICYNVNPTVSGNGSNNINNTYNNNLSYSGTSFATLPPANNIGGGNINNTDPMFVTLFSSNVNTFLDWNADNLRPQAASPVINAGSDGTNIGPTGGIAPIYRSTNLFLTGEPPVPQVKTVNYISNSAIAPGTNLVIQVKGKKIN